MSRCRHVRFDRLHNFRDLGGYAGADGATVRWGLLYRSDSLGKLRGADLERFSRLGVRTVLDLRHPWEVSEAGRVPDLPGLRYLNLSIEHRPFDQAGLGAQVAPGPFLSGKFLQIASDGVAEIRAALDVMVKDGSAPLVMHCASGKDRTGILSALVLGLLGVGQDDICADFALTGLAKDQFVADWSAAHGGHAPAWPAFAAAPEEIMRLFLAGLESRYGSVLRYAARELGVDEALIASLRARLLEHASDADGPRWRGPRQRGRPAG